MKKRIAVLDRELCVPKSCGFYLCQRACPVNRSKEECITVVEHDKKPRINEELCIGCNICVKKCPKNAIMIVNLPEKLEDVPIHRYGPNMFSLYRLPIPKCNTVVGLIGPNGVGKSTVLNILSGDLKPNTGLFEDVPWTDIIGRFKGTELQKFMEALSKKNVKTAYKPQHVDLIPKMWPGKIKHLLKKIDENNRLDEFVSRLNMKELLDKNTENLSGGELQIFAIIATLLKDADLYFFDEPSSYLDVHTRLLVAEEIRKLANDKMVVTVEHDLAVADYLADYIHILYGKPSVFGIVSQSYGVRVGINAFLEGYIKEENIRFRPKEIIFPKTAKQSKKNEVFISFPEFTKKFKGFSMKTEPGKLYKNEIIGILGPNSIGKTTFVKILASELEPDTGKWKPKLSIAYKSQRLILEETENEMTTKEFLEHTAERKIDKKDKTMIRFLELEKLMERKMKNLSGGELQAIFIVSVLMQKKDILLMDEPSAFLDVEQRLRVAKLVRTYVEETETQCFVVDHDLLFMDALADRVMIFEGKPRVSGYANMPCSLKDGMNKFLKSLSITFRRDPFTGRIRANKPGSQKDIEQKSKGEYFYSE